MCHLKEYANPTEDKVLLAVYSYDCCKSSDVISYKKNHGTVTVSSSSLYTLQPLNVPFYCPLKIYYEQEVTQELKCILEGLKHTIRLWVYMLKRMTRLRSVIS
jgi:hypothetical protein